MNKQTATSLVILIATTLIVGGAVLVKNTKSAENKNTGSVSASQKTTSSTDTIASTSNSSSSSASSYKDGTYTASGSYEAPDGQQAIGVTVTVKDGLVTDTSAENQASGRESADYVDRFISDYKSQIVGKKLNELKSAVSSGDSLTLAGFNDAVDQIQQQAQA